MAVRYRQPFAVRPPPIVCCGRRRLNRPIGPSQWPAHACSLQDPLRGAAAQRPVAEAKEDEVILLVATPPAVRPGRDRASPQSRPMPYRILPCSFFHPDATKAPLMQWWCLSGRHTLPNQSSKVLSFRGSAREGETDQQLLTMNRRVVPSQNSQIVNPLLLTTYDLALLTMGWMRRGHACTWPQRAVRPLADQ